MSQVIKSKFHYQDHEDKMYHETTQPSEDSILERNKDLRNNPGVIKDLGSESGQTWGRQVASIPFIIYERAIRDGYDLNNRNPDIAAKEMHRFLQSSIGKTCLIK